MRNGLRTWLTVLAAAGAGGCAGARGVGGGGGAGLYQPEKIEILPFTRVRSFDKDPIPDGVEVVLRPTDALGDATKVYGRYHVALYEYRQASAERKGERLLFWQIEVGTVADQRRWWDRITRTYQFRLLWDRALVPNRKYVLEVTYFSPSEGRLFAEHVLDFRLPAERIREARQP